MSEQTDYEYYARRAEVERALEEKATDPAVARLHREMAQRYDDIIAGNDDTSLNIAGSAASNSNPTSFSPANKESG